MIKVNIYIGISARGPAIKKHASYMYVIKACIKDKECIRSGKGTLENTTENQLALTAIVHALMRFNKGAISALIHLMSMYLTHVVMHGRNSGLRITG